jgi:hypothetical protein
MRENLRQVCAPPSARIPADAAGRTYAIGRPRQGAQTWLSASFRNTHARHSAGVQKHLRCETPFAPHRQRGRSSSHGAGTSSPRAFAIAVQVEYRNSSHCTGLAEPLHQLARRVEQILQRRPAAD